MRIPSEQKRREILTATAIKTISFFAKKLRVKNIVIALRPLPGFAATTGDWLSFRFISVDIDRMVRGYYPPYVLLGVIFHEFGHIMDKSKRTSKVRAEYLAESYGLALYKKYYPEDAKKYIQKMRWCLKHKKFNAKRRQAYKAAFSKIKDYQ